MTAEVDVNNTPNGDSLRVGYLLRMYPRFSQTFDRQIERLNLTKHVELLGSLPQQEVREWMHSSACLALPCVQAGDGNVDALPTVLLEALACGCPVISTKLSGIPEIIEDHVSGMLVDPGDSAELADAIRTVLTDFHLARNLTRGGRKRAKERFDGSRQTGRLRQWLGLHTSPESQIQTLDPVVSSPGNNHSVVEAA